RTARALGNDGSVHISHGDLAGLPGIAAGASSIGTGWDTRQRVSAYSNYEAPDPDADGGQWFSQATHQGLVSCLVRNDAQILADRDAHTSNRLLPGIVPPDATGAWLHHARVLNDLVDSLGLTDSKERYEGLVGMYRDAIAEWPGVATTVGVASQEAAWI